MGRQAAAGSLQFLRNGYPRPTELRWRHKNSVFRRCEWVFSQTYLLGRVVKYAQRTRKFYFTFEKSGLTRFGGLSLFQVFCRSLQIRRFLQVLVHWPDYDYRGSHPADLVLAHVFSIVAGLGRIENTPCLIHNGLVPPLP